MERDLRAEGWGPEDCYPETAEGSKSELNDLLTDFVLHYLRNPHGRSVEDMRGDRLQAARIIESLSLQLVAAEQRIYELLSANGSLQYKNDRLAAKTQRLDVAEKMAREARAEMVAAEQRAEQAEVPIAEAKREADALAIWLWKTHYQEAAPNWELCDSVAGVITQIDNMVCQLIPRERVAEAVRECEKISKPRDKHVAMMIRSRYPQHFEGE